ncbi:hypothetical protein H310_06413 [Aphanomyces invadans]|uniref:Uncharacterized protein n=1 Tax=Aphanomyces invadans TaxID=157072 RepID=A0A024U7J0_9STRA|nr:hypothetical protein H310_06413 [Aphanomyces invadans]ETW01842.1 hypothetical protein H310_06413 [Aphanomyces invadans]|eukprot:XP_008869690.1 hypothetical protein H310_06413 [Aphanomyces invadans]
MELGQYESVRASVYGAVDFPATQPTVVLQTLFTMDEDESPNMTRYGTQLAAGVVDEVDAATVLFTAFHSHSSKDFNKFPSLDVESLLLPSWSLGLESSLSQRRSWKQRWKGLQSHLRYLLGSLVQSCQRELHSASSSWELWSWLPEEKHTAKPAPRTYTQHLAGQRTSPSRHSTTSLSSCKGLPMTPCLEVGTTCPGERKSRCRHTEAPWTQRTLRMTSR